MLSMLPEASGTKRTNQITEDLTFMQFVTQIPTQCCITVMRSILTRMTSATTMTAAESHVISSVNLVTIFTMNGSSTMKTKMEIIALTENCLIISKH